MIQGKSVLALIIARGGSKGIPGKNMMLVRGRPLIAWSIDAARGSKYIDRLILSSDDSKIINAAVEAGCEAPFKREPALATDNASAIDVITDAIKRVPGFDIIFLLQPTSPLRITADIDGALELLISSGAPACVGLRPADDHPFWTFHLGTNGRLSHFVVPPEGMPTRRQELPPAWCINGAVYAAYANWLMRVRSFLSPQTVGYAMPPERSVDIDTPADLSVLETILNGEMNEKISPTS